MSNPKGVALPEHGPSTIVFPIAGPLAREELPSLCERFRAAAEGAGEVVCDVGAIGRADAVAVDALARVTLVARRHGCAVRLRDASDELRALVAFMGLEDVVRYDVSRAGSPNSGNSVSVPRKNVSSTILPSSSSSTWSAHGS